MENENNVGGDGDTGKQCVSDADVLGGSIALGIIRRVRGWDLGAEASAAVLEAAAFSLAAEAQVLRGWGVWK